MFDNNLPYNSFNNYLKKKYNGLVWRVTLEGGFDCPNRDGKRAFGGCTFCTADGSSSRAQIPKDSIIEQLHKGVEMHQGRHKAKKFIAYLQSFTNTYGSIDYLKKVYDSAISHPDIIMLCIGTRPDCLDKDVLELVESYNDKVEVWLDLGLQSAHNKTLQLINRGHSAEEFFEAIENIKKFAPFTKICAHLIAGLPEETLDETFETALILSKLPIDGIKIHNLCILKGTKIGRDYEKGLIKPLEVEDYINLVMKILSIMPKHITIHRLMAESAMQEELLAPEWAGDKDNFLNLLRKIMKEKGIYQGCMNAL